MTTNSLTQIDEKLSLLRESWMDAANEKKPYWMAKINAALDERNELTKQKQQ